MWSTAQADIFCDRTRDAVECLKRALLGADARETTINLKLAKLYEELEEPAEAVAYHRRVVEICRGEGGRYFLLDGLTCADVLQSAQSRTSLSLVSMLLVTRW